MFLRKIERERPFNNVTRGRLCVDKSSNWQPGSRLIEQGAAPTALVVEEKVHSDLLAAKTCEREVRTKFPLP